MECSEAYREGEAYYRRHGYNYKNPYPAATREHNDFERGWTQGLKKNPEIGEKLEKKEGVGSQGYQAEQQAKQTKESLERRKREYLRAKGK